MWAINCFRLVVLGQLFSFTSLYGADRVALVIGIDRYEHLPQESQLSVAVSDARLIAGTLGKLNPPFEVTLLTDVAQRDAMESLTEFVDQAEEAECALVYFAGHGVEYHGSNFLLASDTKITNISPDVERMKRRLSLAALSLQAVVDELDGTKAKVKVVILDACRDNPLKSVGRKGSRSAFVTTRGLAQVSPPTGTLIAFSADAGQQANDGLFTKILAKNLAKPGIPLPHIFALTREEVRAESISLEESNRGVFHEPAEYTKLNVAGMKFSFTLEHSKVSEGFSNSLGMKFVPVTGTKVLFCEHETRVKDYAAFVAENPSVDLKWKNFEFKGHKQGLDHPVFNVSWEDARAFCTWLGKKEGRRYRLPTDHEWSVAVGIGGQEDRKARPSEKSGKVSGYPWGSTWPPPLGAGNFSGSESASDYKIEGYSDRHPFTAPVKSYRANRNGLYDLNGNVHEWVEDLYSNDKAFRVVRGGSWFPSGKETLFSSYRHYGPPALRFLAYGFRCVVEVGG